MAARRSPKPQAWVRFLLLLPGRVSQVERNLPAKQTTSVRFRAAPPRWSALVCGRAL